MSFLAEQNKSCGFNILQSILKEESAKFLILMDSIRCPRVPPDCFSKQLARFNDHLAKGIYSLIYGYRLIDYGEVRRVIEKECHEYYLDGPNDFDWIFRNEILQTREENIYVDYIESDGEHLWLTPKRYYYPSMHPSTYYLKPEVFEVASALWHAGCTKPDALASIADNWRSLQFSDDFSWKQLSELNIKTLEKLDELKLLQNQESSVIKTIIDKWLFPFHNLDIRIIKVDKEKLKEIREDNFYSMYY